MNTTASHQAVAELGLPSLPAEGITISRDDLSREQVLARVGRQLNQRVDREQLLHDASALVAETLNLELGAVSYSEAATSPFTVRLFRVGDSQDELTADAEREFDVPDEPFLSMIRHTMLTGATTVTLDMPKEQRFRDQDLLNERIHSCVAAPLRSAGRIVGAIGALSREPAEIGAGDLAFVETIAHLLSATIARYDAEDSLTEERQLRKALLEKIDSILVEMTLDGEIVTANRSAQNVSGFTDAELAGRNFVSALVIPEECATVCEQLKVVAATHEEQGYCGHLLDHEGERHPVRWNFSFVPAGTGPRIVATGTDLSEAFNLRKELDGSQSRLQEVRQELQQVQKEAESSRLALAVERTQPFGLIREAEHGERRYQARRLYPYVQRIAPVVAGKIPTFESFVEVRCRDIAAGGFSFMLAEPPQQPQYVAAFGVAPALTYLMVNVARTSELEIDGKRHYIVGCKYTGRIDL